MYFHTVTLSPKNVQDILTTANYLMIDTLTSDCVQYIKDRWVLSLSYSHPDPLCFHSDPSCFHPDPSCFHPDPLCFHPDPSCFQETFFSVRILHKNPLFFSQNPSYESLILQSESFTFC